jgi:hypothetical protein
MCMGDLKVDSIKRRPIINEITLPICLFQGTTLDIHIDSQDNWNCRPMLLLVVVLFACTHWEKVNSAIGTVTPLCENKTVRF